MIRFEYAPEDGPIAAIEALQECALQLERIADAQHDYEDPR